MIDFTLFDSAGKKIKVITSNLGAMEKTRRDFEPLWELENKIYLPRRHDLLRNAQKGQQYGARIFDANPALALNKFVLGFLGNMISRSTPWLEATSSNQLLMRNDEVKQYYQEVTEQLLWSFARSNFYGSVVWHAKDASSMGTGIMIPEEDLVKGRMVYHTVHPGESYLEDDQHGNGAIYQRKFKMTAIQMLMKFGEDKLPPEVKQQALAEGSRNPFTEHEVLFAVYKNIKPKPNSLRAVDKPYLIFYILLGKKKSMLLESGMDWFPNLWRQGREDGVPYGTSIGADALTSSLQGNKLAQKNLEAAHMVVEPPTIQPDTLRGKLNLKPKGRTFTSNQEEVKTVLNNLNWPISDAQLARIDAQQDDFMFIRFFEILSSGDFTNITATQANLIKGETVTMMSAIVGGYESEVLEPAIETQFKFEERAGRMPPPPDDLLLAGGEIDIKFVGPLSQLQRSILEGRGIVQALPLLQAIGEVWPASLLKINEMELIEDAGIAQGMKQTYFKSDDEVAVELQAIEQARQQDQLRETAIEGAKAVPGLGKSVEPNSPLAAIAEAV